MRHLYLDYNATTPLAPSVQEAMLPFLAHLYGDPASDHSLGRASHEALQDARSQLANLLGADADEIVFTSGGTESNNLALKGLFLKGTLAGGGHLVISTLEHASVVGPAKFLERMGFDVSIVGCTGQGVIQPSAIRAALRTDTILVSVVHANHEVGAINPLRQIAEVCHERQVLLHTDASQTVGKIRTLVDELDVDLLTVAGHKMYAPKGVGALYVRRGIPLEPLLHGAGHEGGQRAGTEALPQIVGLGKAAQLAAKSLDESQERLTQLRDRLWHQLQLGVGDGLLLNAQLSARLPGTLSVSFPEVGGHELLARVPELCAWTAAAAHGDTAGMSATLAAMGISSDQARGTIRLSLGWYTTEGDVDRAASLLIAAWESLK